MAEPKPEFRLELVDDAEGSAPPQTAATDSRAADVLLLALTALSKRTLTALASLFSLLTVAAVFWLALSIAADPTINQIVTLGIFSAFVLLINWIARVRK